LALTLGAFHFSNQLRARYLKVHRVMHLRGSLVHWDSDSRTAGSEAWYAVAYSGLCGAGFPLDVNHGDRALLRAQRGNVVQHRRWMIRGYPFAMAFTAARVIIPIAPIPAMGNAGVENGGLDLHRHGSIPAQSPAGVVAWVFFRP
jgi:hypothetical protein